ncbi:MAG: hypothetical protein ACIARR_08320 [Phycisphaerales bacterium JB059]
MQNLKADIVLFLTSDNRTEQDRAAAKLLAPCTIEVRHVEGAEGQSPRVDVLIHAPPRLCSKAHDSDAAGRIENALRNASDHPLRMMQWVEEGATQGPRPATGAGDANSHQSPVGHATSGLPPKPRRDRHDPVESPVGPGDQQARPPAQTGRQTKRRRASGL